MYEAGRGSVAYIPCQYFKNMTVPLNMALRTLKENIRHKAAFITKQLKHCIVYLFHNISKYYLGQNSLMHVSTMIITSNSLGINGAGNTAIPAAHIYVSERTFKNT
jgi:hypothetical protein